MNPRAVALLVLPCVGLLAAVPAGAWDRTDWSGVTDIDSPIAPALVGAGIGRDGDAEFFVRADVTFRAPGLVTRRRPAGGDWLAPTATADLPALVRTNARGDRLTAEFANLPGGGIGLRAGGRLDGADRPAVLLLAPIPEATTPDRISLAAALADSGRALIAVAAGAQVTVIERGQRGRWRRPLVLRRGAPVSALLAETNAVGDAIVTWHRGRAGATRIESRRRRGPLRWTAPAIVTPRPGTYVSRLALDSAGRGHLIIAGLRGRPFAAVSPPAARRWRAIYLGRPGERLSPRTIGVDGAGRALAIWTREREGRLVRMAFAVGAGWRRSGLVPERRGGVQFPTPVLAVGELGEAVLIVDDGRFIPFAQRRDPFGRWSAPSPVGQTTADAGLEPPFLAINAAGDALAVARTGESNTTIFGYAALERGPRRPAVIDRLTLRPSFPRIVTPGRVPRIELTLGRAGPVLVEVRRSDHPRPLAATIVAGRAGRQTIDWTPSMRAVVRRPRGYVLAVRTGGRGAGQAVEALADIRIGL